MTCCGVISICVLCTVPSDTALSNKRNNRNHQTPRSVPLHGSAVSPLTLSRLPSVWFAVYKGNWWSCHVFSRISVSVNALFLIDGFSVALRGRGTRTILLTTSSWVLGTATFQVILASFVHVLCTKYMNTDIFALPIYILQVVCDNSSTANFY